MSERKVHHIWSPESGIRDYEVPAEELAVAESARIRQEWASIREAWAETEQARAFNERLEREWSIETGIIENLYYIDRGTTVTLIEQGFQVALMEHGSVDKDPEYIKAILEDQQVALEGLFAFVKQDRHLSTSYIKELHAAMTRSQPHFTAYSPSGDEQKVPMLHGEYKKHPNYPVRGEVEYRYCPPEQTASEMDRLVALHLQHVALGVAPEVEAAWLHHRFTQIHPFADGNGRVARALASLVLIRGGMFPLVVPREEKDLYLRALELADEGRLRNLVLLVGRRQEVAMNKVRETKNRLTPVSGLRESAQKLGRVYASDPILQDERLAALVSQVGQHTYDSLVEFSRIATTEMLRVANIPSAGGGGLVRTAGPAMGVAEDSTAQFQLLARGLVYEEQGQVLESPARRFVVRLVLQQEHRLLVEVSVADKVARPKIAVCAVLLGDKPKLLHTTHYFEVSGLQLVAGLVGVRLWAEQVIGQFLNEVASEEQSP